MSPPSPPPQRAAAVPALGAGPPKSYPRPPTYPARTMSPTMLRQCLRPRPHSALPRWPPPTRSTFARAPARSTLHEARGVSGSAPTFRHCCPRHQDPPPKSRQGAVGRNRRTSGDRSPVGSASRCALCAVGRRRRCREDILRSAGVVYDVYTHMPLDCLRRFARHEQRQRDAHELWVAGLTDSGAGRWHRNECSC